VPGLAGLRRYRLLKWVSVVVAVAVFSYFVPLFHVVPLQAARDDAALAGFDVAAFVDPFWDGPLREAAERAPDAAELLASLQHDFAGTADRYGRRLGLGGRISFLVSGIGRVAAIDSNAVTIALSDNDPAEVIIRTGPVFGNALRDASGLFDVSDFASAQDFNAISAEINRRVEAQVLPQLEAIAEPGAAIRFAGGVELADTGQAPGSLNLVPLLIETQ